MSQATGVFFESDAEPSTGAAEALASLPLSYVRGHEVRGSLVVVPGASGWPTAVAAALDQRAAAVLVVDPQPADVQGLVDRRALVVLDTTWASDPSVSSAADAFREALPRADRLECRVVMPVGTSTESALLGQLQLVRVLVGQVADVRMLVRSTQGYAAEGESSGRAVDLDLVCTDAVSSSMTVRMLLTDGAVELVITGSTTARPSLLTVTTPQGSVLAPTLYESGHRASWRRVRTLMSTRSTAPDLKDFASDRAAVRRAVQLNEG